MKPEPELTDALKLLIALTAAAGGSAANESFIHSARLLSCGAILRGVILIYCLSQFGFFFMSAQFCSTGESSKIEKKTSLTEFFF